MMSFMEAGNEWRCLSGPRFRASHRAQGRGPLGFNRYRKEAVMPDAIHAYRRDLSKRLLRQYAEKWAGLPLPRLQLRWGPKPVAKSEYRAEQRRTDSMLRSMKIERLAAERKWDCFYELVLPVDRYDIRNEHYEVGFIIVPICWTRRGGLETYPEPCSQGDGIDTPYRDGSHAYWDSKALNWLPIYVVAPDGTARQKTDYIEAPQEWAAQGMSAGTAKTEGLGATPASPVPKECAHD